MADKIDNLFARLTRARASRAAPRPSTPKKTSAKSTRPSGNSNLRQTISRALQNVDLSTAAGKFEGRSVFFRAVLLSELPEMQSDNEKFDAEVLARSLETQFSKSPQLRVRLDKLLITLKNRAP